MTEIFKVKTGVAPELMKMFLNLLMYLIVRGISLNVTGVYHVPKGMALKQHLLQVQNYRIRFPEGRERVC